MKKIILLFALCVSVILAGVACTQTEQSILTGATTLATAVAALPLPADVANTPAGQQISYWSQYAAGLLAAVNKVTPTIPATTSTVATTVNPPVAPAQGQ